MATETKIIQIEVNHTTALGDIVELQKKIDSLNTTMKELDRTTVGGAKAYAGATVQVREYRAQLNSLVKESANEIKVHTEKIGYLEKLAADVSNLEKAYQRLSKAELDNKAVGGAMVEQLKKKRAELAQAQAEYGKYSMNVGNYASATNMLAINVGQVMKEIPNFAISARIGIMSLTNNLPMLAEAIKAVRVQQAQMIAEGQKAPSMFSLISKSVFGLTGLMSILMVLMQVFAPKVIAWAESFFKGEKAIRQATDAQLGFKSAVEATRDALKNGGEYKTATEQVMKMRASLEASKGSTELSKKALDDYNSSLGVTFGKANDVDEALQAITNNEDAYIEAMKNMALANALFSSSAEDAVKIAEISTKKQSDLVREAGYNYQELYDKVKAFDDRIKKLDETGATREYGFGRGGQSVSREQLVQFRLEAAKEITRIEAEEKTRQIGIAKGGFEQKNKLATEYLNNYAKIIKDNNFNVTKTVLDSAKAVKEGLKDETKDLYDYYTESYMRLLAEFNKALTLSELEDYAQKYLKKGVSLEQPKTEFDDFSKWINSASEANLQRLNNEIASEEDAAQRKKKIVEAYVNESRMLLGALSDWGRAKDEQTLANYAKTISGKANYDELYAQKKYELEYESAKREKALNIFSATIDTAGAIIGYLKDPGGTAGIILSSLAGVTGAAQIAAIASQPLPVQPSGSTGGSSVTGSVTEKFHTGTYRPATQTEEKEITRTLLTTERVLSPSQTGIFDSIINRVQSYGGASSITSDVGVNNVMQAKMMEIAMSKALRNMPAPVMSWSEFQYQVDRMRQLEQNKFIR